MAEKRTMGILFIVLALASTVCVRGAVADSVVVPTAQFAPLTENPHFKIFSSGEGIEWVPGYETVWIAGVDFPPRAKMTNMVVYCLDNVAPNAMAQLFRTKGDGSPPTEIETVVTGGSKEKPGTGYMSSGSLVNEARVDNVTYHYYVKVFLPARPDDVRGILRVTSVEIVYEK